MSFFFVFKFFLCLMVENECLMVESVGQNEDGYPLPPFICHPHQSQMLKVCIYNMTTC